MSWPTVPEIQDNVTTLNASGLGAITDALTERTQELLTRIGDGKYENALVVNDSCMGGLTQGTVVYFNTTLNRYQSAEPVSTSSNGLVIPADSAYIAGIVCNNPSAEGDGKLLVSGVVSASLVGFTNASRPGPYYLGDNGTLVTTPPEGRLAVYCGYLTSTQWFIFSPASPSPKITDQTIAAPIASIIPGPGIAASSSTGNRTVTLSTQLTSGGAISSGGMAVARIENGQLVTTPVINGFSSTGLGVDINVDNGIATIEATGLSHYLDLQTINANNVLIGGAINDSLITFPAGIASSIIGLVRLPHQIPAEGIRLFVWAIGSVSGLSAAITPIRYGEPQTTISGITFSNNPTAPSTKELWSALQSTVRGDDLLRIVFSVSGAASAVSLQALGVIV